MSGAGRWLRRLRGVPGAPKVRHAAELAVTPHVRAEIAELREQVAHLRDQLALPQGHRILLLEDRVERATTLVGDLSAAQPVVLSAISSVNGIARIAKRDQAALATHLGERVDGVAAHADLLSERIGRLEGWVVEHSDDVPQLVKLLDERIAPHVQSIEWLLERVETVRKEVLYELRYGAAGAPGRAAVPGEDTAGESPPLPPASADLPLLEGEDLRLNLGCGHVALEGFVNVDMRALPGVDVVVPIDRLPVAEGSVAEIFSAHVLEHFPLEQLRRHLLPYWVGLLRPGGRFRAVVPDIDAMSGAYTSGEIGFDEFREVLYGGQEYEGDTHFNGFTPTSLTTLLAEAGLAGIEIVASARPNGPCLELEVAATRPEG